MASGLSDLKNPLMNKGLPKHEIECRDFRWLPTATQTPPVSLKIARWDSEDNEKNNETGANENRTVGGAYDVSLRAVSRNRLEISSISQITGFIDSSPILNLFANQSLSIMPDENHVCQVGLSSNLQAEVIGTYQELEGKAPSPAERPDYIVGTDELLEQVTLRSRLKNWTGDETSRRIYE